MHMCVAADDPMAATSAGDNTTPHRSDEALGTRNFANAVTGDTQNQPLPGAGKPRTKPQQAAAG